MDFNDIEDQIELNKERLKDESERYNEIRSRIGFISIVYTLFAAYGFQLVLFALREESVDPIYFIALVIFFLLIIFSVVNAVRLMIPVKIAHRDLPTYFYNEVKSQYLENGISESQTDAYIKHTYKLQLEEALKTNFRINNRKSKFHYNAFVFALISIIPYLICTGIYVSSESDTKLKVELTNQIFNDMSKQEKDKQPIDTSKIIVKKPIMIRENQSKEQGNKVNENERRKEKGN